MQLETLDREQLIVLTNKTEDKDALREIATFLGATFSGNTGIEKLKEKIMENLPEEEIEEENLDEAPALTNDPVAAALAAQIANEAENDEDVHVEAVKQTHSITQMMEMDASKVKDAALRRKVIRTQAFRMRRVRITNLDPNDASVPSTLVTVYSKYTGKVSKLIPHDSEFYENGYHIPQIIYDELKVRTYNVRKEKKRRGQNNFGVKEYETSVQKKFVIEDLPDLTPAQLKNLAASQEGRGAIDRGK